MEIWADGLGKEVYRMRVAFACSAVSELGVTRKTTIPPASGGGRHGSHLFVLWKVECDSPPAQMQWMGALSEEHCQGGVEEH